MFFSFIHISDIHLGRPFSDLTKYSFDEKVKSVYNNAVEKAFNNFIDFALVKNIDFVLISGDTFDNNEQDFRSKLILKEGLKKLAAADIKVYIVCGNHDPVSAYNKNTFNFDDNSNIKIIGVNTPQYGKFIVTDKNSNPQAIIHAYSFNDNHLNENPIHYFESPQGEEKSLFNIGLLHCDLDGDKTSPYAPCSTNDLKSLNYDYWALGHIHIPTYDEKTIQYAGTIQSRNTKETGPHGIKYIKVENNSIIKNSFIPIDIIRFENINIDLSQAYDITFAYNIIQEFILDFINKNSNANCELFLLKLNLNGNICFYSDINEDFYNTIAERIKNDFNNRVYISEISNETRPKINEQIIKEDDGISGEIYRTIDENNLNTAIENIEKNFKNILLQCNFTEKEYKEFKEEIKNQAKEECINLCNIIYYNEIKQE